jgi:hypothetical protein
MRSDGIEPSFHPSGELRLWLLTGLAFIAILAVSEGGAYWLTAEDRKPMAETGLPEAIKPPVPNASIDPLPRLVVGLPPIVAPPAMPISPKPAPQQPPSQMPKATAHPQPAEPAKELPSSVRF